MERKTRTSDNYIPTTWPNHFIYLSSRSLSHLLMSFLYLIAHADVRDNFMEMRLFRSRVRLTMYTDISGRTELSL